MSLHARRMRKARRPDYLPPAHKAPCTCEVGCSCPCRCADRHVIPRRMYLGAWWCMACGRFRGARIA